VSPTLLKSTNQSCFMALLLLRTDFHSRKRIAVELNQLDKQKK